MATYDIHLLPVSQDGVSQVITIEGVEIGFNQLGWMIFTDQKRETVAMFLPTQVRFVNRVTTDDVGETEGEFAFSNEVN